MRKGSRAAAGIQVVAALAVSSRLLAGPPDHQCAAIPDDAQRLACYDAAFGKPVKTDAAPPAAPTSVAPPAARVTITSTVTAIEHRRDGRFVTTLANGEVWAQSELDSKASVSIGDTVTVRPASLGSYLIVTKAGIATRAKRLR